jgi:hypothetical protein
MSTGTTSNWKQAIAAVPRVEVDYVAEFGKADWEHVVRIHRSRTGVTPYTSMKSGRNRQRDVIISSRTASGDRRVRPEHARPNR